MLEPEIIGPPECPILHRWTLGGDRFASRLPFKVLLHHFMPHADDRDVHDHPRPFVTLVLRGDYDDLVPCSWCIGSGFADIGGGNVGRSYAPAWRSCPVCDGTTLVLGDRMRAGTLRLRRADHAHRTKVGPRGCWTLVVMGPVQRPWGFWRSGKWWPWREYIAMFGTGFRCGDESASASTEGSDDAR